MVILVAIGPLRGSDENPTSITSELHFTVSFELVISMNKFGLVAMNKKIQDIDFCW